MSREIYYVDGLVSTGKFNSLHNIKNIFLYLKKFSMKFYSHFILMCGNPKELKHLFNRFNSDGLTVPYAELTNISFML